MTTPEHDRLAEIQDDKTSWRRWGPYVSDRSWGTVREDYSADGNAWDYLPFDRAAAKAYRWGEDGIAGISDRYQLLVFAPAFWNHRDAIIKERLFGVVPTEGNHGEDVKEYYFYLDNTPTHSYMKFLYKYPQAAFPYRKLVEENRLRQGRGPEFELLDTGIFAQNRYFDIFVEYAKSSPEEFVVRIEAVNRGPEAAVLDILPHLWFRNIWAWGPESWGRAEYREPAIRPGPQGQDFISLLTDDSKMEELANVPIEYRLGPRVLYGPRGGALLFTDNETNGAAVYGAGNLSRKPHCKDAFQRWLIHGEECLNRAQIGTKAAIHYRFQGVPPGASAVLRFRLSEDAALAAPLAEVDSLVALRKAEADAYYDTVHPRKANEDERRIQRQALAGLLWTKQSYIFSVQKWLDGDNPAVPPPAARRSIRNQHWRHLNSMRVMTVPDKWEYPWFATWDLAFHCVAFALIDARFAKDQLKVMLFEQFQHPNGQLPAYEWDFSDLNPPVHAWAVWRVYNMDRIRSGKADRDFLERCFHKLLINFTWWVNKVDRTGNNIFEGGFLGLDNIAVFDRSQPLRNGAVLEQADATGWMGMFCLNLMRIALELAREDRTYEDLATKFFQHYAYVASAMKHMGDRDYQLWDEEDGFFYDVLRYPDGHFEKLRVRSLVGLIPLFAVERLEANWIKPFKEFSACLEWFLKNRGDLIQGVVHTVQPKGELTRILTIVNEAQLVRILQRVFHPDEFLAPYGLRSMSKHHQAHPFECGGNRVCYEPGEADSKIKGGNSNWRGPVWFPTCFLLIESLRKLAKAYGNDFRVALPQVNGGASSLPEMARLIAERMIGLFARDSSGRRPFHGGNRTFQEDPHWRDHLLFYEYFHGDTGAGLGASHQTGWTALAACLIDEWRQ
jgi:hypothetical protein